MRIRIAFPFSDRRVTPFLHRARKLVAALAVATATAIMFAGCGSGSSGNTTGSGTSGGLSNAPSGGTTGTNLTSAQIVSTINTVQTKFQSMMDAGTDIPTRDAQIVTFLKTQPTISIAGQGADGCVWARFTNNRYYMILDNRTPVSTSKQAQSDFGQPVSGPHPVRHSRRAAKSIVSTSTRSPSSPVHRAADGMAIPQSKQARLLKALDTATFGDSVPQIQDFLQRRGYDVTVQEGSVENLRSIQNDGIFYIDTHGGLGHYTDGSSFWMTWTSSQISEQNDSLYRDDLNDGSLLYITAINGTAVNGQRFLSNHYGITANFIKKYHWSFAKDSFSYLNCCYGSNPGVSMNQDLRALSMPVKSTIGWTAPIAGLAIPVAIYFFDRLLGTNAVTPQASSRRRPFESEIVYRMLIIDGHFQETYTGSDHQSHVSAIVKDGPDFLLTPTIQTMEMKERIAESPIRGKTELTLHGHFGSRQGTVKIGGTEVPVTTWDGDTIVCQPADKPGDGFSGDVEVSIDDHDSNAVALTQWHGKLTYTIDMLPPQAASAQSVITIDAIFRADLHDYRTFPDREPIKQDAVAFRVAQGSTCHWQVNGDPLPMSVWAGPTSADFPFGLNANPTPYGTGYILSGTIDPTSKKVAFSFNYLSTNIPYIFPGSANPAIVILALHDPLLTSIASGINTKDGYIIYAKNIPATIGDDDVIPAITLNGSTPILEPQLKLADFIPSAVPVKENGEDQDPH